MSNSKPGRPRTGRIQMPSKPFVDAELARALELERKINNKPYGVSLSEHYKLAKLYLLQIK